MVATATVRVAALGVEALPRVEALSRAAFDPRYGEAWSKAQCLSVLALPGYRLRGAWLGEGQGALLAGFAIDRWVADEGELLLLAVDPAHRRAGIATALLADWLDHAGERRIARLFLEMRADNPARALYLAHGFGESGVRPEYYRGADGVMRDAVTMDRRNNVQ